MGQSLSQCSTQGCTSVNECTVAYDSCSERVQACIDSSAAERVQARGQEGRPVIPPSGRHGNYTELPELPTLSEWHENKDQRLRNEAQWDEAEGEPAVHGASGLPAASAPRTTPGSLREALAMEELPPMPLRPEASVPFVSPEGFSAQSDSRENQSQLSARSTRSGNKIMWPDGSCYEGERVNGYAHGWGKLVRIDGSHYAGEWRNGEKSGRGSEVWPEGTTYEGEYTNSSRHGHGVFKVQDGMIYEGQFVNEKMEGSGACIFADGRKFVGQWQQGHITGQGKMTWPNGSEYSGQYVADSKDGIGTFNWPDGRSYQGEWRRGKQEGMGMATDVKGNIMHGKWGQGRLLTSARTAESPKQQASSMSSEKHLGPGRSHSPSGSGIAGVPAG